MDPAIATSGNNVCVGWKDSSFADFDHETFKQQFREFTSCSCSSIRKQYTCDKLSSLTYTQDDHFFSK